MKRIILTTDFSKKTQNAVDYALYLFKDKKCMFYLLHAYHDAPSASGTTFDSENDLRQMLKRIETKNSNNNLYF